MEFDWYRWFESTSWLEWAKAIFDLAKGVAWPLAGALIIFYFRNEIRDRIKDVVSVGPGTIVLRNPQEQATQNPPTGLIKPITHPFTTVLALVEKITEQLGEIPENERMGKLVSVLAEAQMERNFEYIWGMIFGSQVQALRRLKETGSASIDEAKRFYEEEVKPAHKDAFSEYSFEQWADFLYAHHLVTNIDGDRIGLTDLGRDFLTFLDLRKKDFRRGF